MLRKFAAAALPLLFIAACGAERGTMPPMAASAPEMAMQRSGSGLDAKIRGETGSADPTVQQFIAYSHSVGMRLPLKAIEPTQQAHVAACNNAGPAVCVVTNSWMSSYDTDYMSGSLSLRATPIWIETFLSGVEDEAKAVKGEISNRQTTAEDLTVSIIDTDARMQALETLRGRLQQLLADRPGALGEILETERELARVNGEIDSLKSTLTALRQRVDMSQLTVSYETKRDAVTQGGNAIGRAFSDFFANLASATAAVITGFAFGLPWMLLLGALLWIWLRLLWPRIRRKKPAA